MLSYSLCLPALKPVRKNPGQSRACGAAGEVGGNSKERPPSMSHNCPNHWAEGKTDINHVKNQRDVLEGHGREARPQKGYRSPRTQNRK